MPAVALKKEVDDGGYKRRGGSNQTQAWNVSGNSASYDRRFRGKKPSMRRTNVCLIFLIMFGWGGFTFWLLFDIL